MSKYIGPSCRLCRREGLKLFIKGERCLTAKCSFSKKKKTPGAVKSKKGKPSYFGLQLREKQKVKRFYFISELQFRKYFEMASRARENTGDVLLQILERRLDNVIYRLGFGTSRKQSRELIAHGHILVNEKKVDITSFLVKKGDIISIRESMKESPLFQANVKREIKMPTWLEKMNDFSGKVMEYPTREEINDIPIKEQMIIELYSK